MIAIDKSDVASVDILTEVGDIPNYVLKVRHLTKKFGGQTLLDDLALDLQRGEVVLLRGDNGSGKTTLLNILTGYLEPDAGEIDLSIAGTSEKYCFPITAWQRLGLGKQFSAEGFARSGGGRVWQDIRLFKTQSLRDNLAVGNPQQVGENPLWAIFRPLAVRRQSRQVSRIADSWLAEFGLSGRENSSADRVSLGQSKRVAIARTLQAGAKLVFLDEPLAGLDAAGIAEVMALLKRLATEEHLTLVIVEHVFNIPRVLDLATTVWTLTDGKVRVEHPEVVRSQLGTTVDGLDAWVTQLAGKGERVDRQLSGGAIWTTVAPAAVGEVVLEIENLVVYRGKRLVIGKHLGADRLEGLSLRLRRGELGMLYAPNGWGKTTLLEAIAGLLPIAGGEIRVNGRSVKKLPSWERMKLGMTFLQARDNVFTSLGVRDVLRLARVREVPGSIRHFLKRQVSCLSGGERQKVAMACVLNGQPFDLGLLDEPFSALDPEAVTQLQALVLERLSGVGFLIAIPAIAGDVRDFYESN